MKVSAILAQNSAIKGVEHVTPQRLMGSFMTKQKLMIHSLSTYHSDFLKNLDLV